MRPDRVSNPGPLIYESGVLPIALRGRAAAVVIGALRVNSCFQQLPRDLANVDVLENNV